MDAGSPGGARPSHRFILGGAPQSVGFTGRSPPKASVLPGEAPHGQTVGFTGRSTPKASVLLGEAPHGQTVGFTGRSPPKASGLLGEAPHGQTVGFAGRSSPNRRFYRAKLPNPSVLPGEAPPKWRGTLVATRVSSLRAPSTSSPRAIWRCPLEKDSMGPPLALGGGGGGGEAVIHQSRRAQRGAPKSIPAASLPGEALQSFGSYRAEH